MLFKNITILDEDFNAVPNCFAGIKEDRIDYIGREMPQQDYGRVYDGTGKLLISGFVNAHAHTPMMYMRGFGGGLNLQDWLEKKIFPFEAKLSGRDVYYSTLMGIAESLRFGITSTTDMYYYGDQMARAILESGVKENLGISMLCFTDEEYYQLPNYTEVSELYRDYHNAGGGRLKIDMSIHGEYTSTPKTVRQLSEYCAQLGARMHLHLSETEKEHEECKQRHHMTPAAYFESLGTFDNPTTAAHCVWLEAEDFSILAERGVTAASCPVSNLKLASGVCNVPGLREKGVNVALGTDGVSSNNNLNIIEDMKIFALVHKAWFHDPMATSPREALYAATRAGALSQGREDCGVIRVGSKADIAVLDMNAIHMRPVHDVVDNLVYAALGSDVVMTMVDGKILYENGVYTTIDMEKVMYEIDKTTSRILGEL